MPFVEYTLKESADRLFRVGINNYELANLLHHAALCFDMHCSICNTVAAKYEERDHKLPKKDK